LFFFSSDHAGSKKLKKKKKEPYANIPKSQHCKGADLTYVNHL